jgi:hypothetical protein
MNFSGAIRPAFGWLRWVALNPLTIVALASWKFFSDVLPYPGD